MSDAASSGFQPRVFSGVQPTGNLHLGNYLGAIRRWVALQATHPCMFCVVDLHAITVWQDPAQLERSIREVTAAFIASGIDADKHIVFNQSRVPQHAGPPRDAVPRSAGSRQGLPAYPAATEP